MRAALVQLNVTDLPEENLPVTLSLIDRAVAGGAEFVLTPEVTNCISTDRAHQRAVLRHEEDDPTLAALRTRAREHGIWLLIGSLALLTHDPDGRFANRSFLITPEGEIAARYDKIHMFDVQVSETEVYRESSGYRPGEQAEVVSTPFGVIGLSICYDLRFPYLYRALAKAGADILTVPAAFNTTTGAAHWEPLLRARAIETGCFVLAPAQTGTHVERKGPGRKTYGHGLVIAPWGEVLADAGTEPGVMLIDLDLAEVRKARARVPSLDHDRAFAGP
ncbi:amidohydrolase [Haematobacter massiliensis]|uniref:Amidohydrolase n=1 Tax=Haematobacter massiliensis TaxID=195105 RepID=A0A086YAH4_9RHOB|nr:carbon-nitrogen hydrolase family protein [Haematobacter massiliensis]KFI31274.1 amidohydrolase [Haematobacter massiliensis]OWJ74154.1 amidohydrolase [Haematobacter massiliensis]OWJ87011.1 amidohydrolase [Haematobacter massiliensis]QBJ23345.1 carbon-nitrogen hydrolase family protein [Haematobacter massiliensis]